MQTLKYKRDLFNILPAGQKYFCCTALPQPPALLSRPSRTSTGANKVSKQKGAILKTLTFSGSQERDHTSWKRRRRTFPCQLQVLKKGRQFLPRVNEPQVPLYCQHLQWCTAPSCASTEPKWTAQCQAFRKIML